MRNLLKQIAVVAGMNIASIPRRPWMSISAIVSIAMVVGVLLGFQAMTHGFRLAVRGTGATDVAMVLREGSQSEMNSSLTMEQVRLIEEAPGIATDSHGHKLVSPELYVIVSGYKRSATRGANVALRGVAENAATVRSGVIVSAGRMFTPGHAEIVAGRSLSREFPDFQLGRTVHLGSQAFQVVGIFDAGGSALESEAWTDYRLIQTLYERGPSVQSVRVRLSDPSQLQALRAYVKADQRLKMEAVDEKSYYARIASGMLNVIFFLGWPLAIVMSIGALAGLLNTMYASVNARRRELATLRALGFEGFPTFIGTLCEGLLLAAVGGILATAVAYLALDGLSTSTLGGGFTQVVFSIRLNLSTIAEALALALFVGTLGGLLAAIRATRINALSTFRD